MANIIQLYHGTIYDFDKIDVTKGKWNKDFGRGFYTSRDIGHADYNLYIKSDTKTALSKVWAYYLYEEKLYTKIQSRKCTGSAS